MHHQIIELQVTGTRPHAGSQQQEEHLGMQHLVMELYRCNPLRLVDKMSLHTFFSDLPDHIQMQQVSPVTMFDITTGDPQDDGISGFVVIATSHIAFHCWPGYQAVSCDVYSCESFVPEQVLAAFLSYFEADAETSEVYLVRRGLRFPRLAKHPLAAHRMDRDAFKAVAHGDEGK